MNTTTPLVSFVVLSYNYGRYIGETIRSILDQQGDHEFEIIIVDDASTDNSHDVISSFRDARIRYFRREHNHGHAATVTDGLCAARGKYVARIDSDDRYRPHFLNEVVPILEQKPEVGLVYGDAAIINHESALTAPATDQQHDGRDFEGNEYVALLEKNFICAPTVMARRAAWQAALPVPAGLSFHDWYFTLAIARQWKLHFRNVVLADYRVHGNNYHTVIARNRTEERSIIWLLDQLFSETEHDEQLQAAKLTARSRIYAAHYHALALKYFGAAMMADARRCYLAALRHRPAYLSSPAVMRHLLATLIGPSAYQRLKGIVKRD